MARCCVALKVGNVRKVAETITPQLPAPPPRRAQNTEMMREEKSDGSAGYPYSLDVTHRSR
jgi:hypothetical protein